MLKDMKYQHKTDRIRFESIDKWWPLEYWTFLALYTGVILQFIRPKTIIAYVSSLK